MTLLAISNANARKVAKKGSSLTSNLLPRGTLHHKTQSPDDLAQVFEQPLKHLIIEGGDGTVRTVLTALLNHAPKGHDLPAISIVPRGTTNQIARNLGVKKPSDLTPILKGSYRALHMPLVKIETGEHLPKYGFLFSTGALPYVSQFAQDKLNAKGVGGGSAVIGAVMKAVTSERGALMPPAHHKITGIVQEQSITQHQSEALGTLMTTLPTLMLGLDPFWGTENAPLRFTWAEAQSAKLGRTVAGLWAGRKQNRSRDGYHSHNIDRLDLQTSAPATLDGDFLDISGQELKISTSQPLTFWVKK